MVAWGYSEPAAKLMRAHKGCQYIFGYDPFWVPPSYPNTQHPFDEPHHHNGMERSVHTPAETPRTTAPTTIGRRSPLRAPVPLIDHLWRRYRGVHVDVLLPGYPAPYPCRGTARTIPTTSHGLIHGTIFTHHAAWKIPWRPYDFVDRTVSAGPACPSCPVCSE